GGEVCCPAGDVWPGCRFARETWKELEICNNVGRSTGAAGPSIEKSKRNHIYEKCEAAGTKWWRRVGYYGQCNTLRPCEAAPLFCVSPRCSLSASPWTRGSNPRRSPP